MLTESEMKVMCNKCGDIVTFNPMDSSEKPCENGHLVSNEHVYWLYK